LLLGTALLFWGAMTGHGLAGLGLALLVEGCHWTRLRWDFDELASIRAWRISVLVTAVTIIWFWFEGNPYMAVPRALGWLPALLLPLQFVQAYGLRETMWLRTFTFFSQHQRELNLRYGTALSEVQFNFGYVYLIAVMLGSTPLGGMPESALFLPGLVVLTGWALLASGRCRWSQVVLLMGVVWAIGLGGQYGLDQAYRWYNFGMFRDFQPHLAPDYCRTAIGRLGEIKQSPGIVWRVRPLAGSVAPTHLRTISYNRYSAGGWINFPPKEKDGVQVQGADEDFTPIPSVEGGEGKDFRPLRAKGGKELLRPALPRFALRGSASNRSPLPLPGNAAGLLNFDVESIEYNSLGTVHIFPKATVADGTVVWNDPGNPESRPWPEIDLGIDEKERATLRQIVAELRLAEVPTLTAKLQVLHRFFQDFEYTRYNSIQAPRGRAGKGATAISIFLTKARRGHCEYFATAACLLLREAGIPSRYAIGYSVSEFNAKRGEWVIRGIHGHAWTRVWDASAGLWLDFDPTPASWLAAETQTGSSLQWFFDWVSRLNEDFALWRSRPLNRWLVSGTMILLGTAGLLFIVRRLWKSRRQVGPRGVRGKAGGAVVRTPLHRLEKTAAKHLAPRLQGQPFGAWLAALDEELTDSSVLTEAIELHQRLRFDPAEPEPAVAQRLKCLAEELEASLKRRRVIKPGGRRAPPPGP
jgi:hypothetical protein